jgi:hypothetical protein
MRIRFTIDIERRRPELTEELVPQGDVYAQAERAAYTDGPQIGFQREEPEWEDRR